MIEERSDHAAVSMGNKIFVIGGVRTTSCEVFDSYSRKFTMLNTRLNKPAIDGQYFAAFCVGNSIVVFHHYLHDLADWIIYLYDGEEKKWSNIDCGVTKNLYGPNCLKYYKQ